MIIKSATIFHKFLATLFNKWFTIKCDFYDFDPILKRFCHKRLVNFLLKFQNVTSMASIPRKI